MDQKSEQSSPTKQQMQNLVVPDAMESPFPSSDLQTVQSETTITITVTQESDSDQPSFTSTDVITIGLVTPANEEPSPNTDVNLQSLPAVPDINENNDVQSDDTKLKTKEDQGSSTEHALSSLSPSQDTVENTMEVRKPDEPVSAAKETNNVASKDVKLGTIIDGQGSLTVNVALISPPSCIEETVISTIEDQLVNKVPNVVIGKLAIEEDVKGAEQPTDGNSLIVTELSTSEEEIDQFCFSSIFRCCTRVRWTKIRDN